LGVKTQALLRNVVTMGFEGCDTAEGAAEVMALSHRDRRLVADTALHPSHLQPGDDNPMGISTLLRLWDHLPVIEREHLLRHMEAHATTVDDGLKLLTLGLDSGVALPRPGSNDSAKRSQANAT
jgi:hypothetical protein